MAPRQLHRSFVAWCLCALLGLMAAVPTRAAEAQPTAADPALEERVNQLSTELRCLVCQNQSLADSHADLAIDLKNQVREQLKAGRTDRQVIDYMTARYGDFVLYRPPVKGTTMLLWGGPLLLLLAGAVLLWRSLNAGVRARPLDPLEPDLAGRLQHLLETQPDAPSQVIQVRTDEAAAPGPVDAGAAPGQSATVVART